MNKFLAALAVAIGLVSVVNIASAGVVITETETVLSGQPGGQAQPPHRRTLMIQGNKQKMVLDGGRAVITDLDKGTMQIIDPMHKSYFERPFPPHDMMAQRAGATPPQASSFTRTGKTRTVAGHKCEEYSGAGKFGLGDFTLVYCVSTKVPGAAEYTKFQKAMIDKLKDSQLAMPANMPDGIPLVQDNTTKMGISNMPNLPPQAAERLKKQFADRPPIVTKTEVTKVEARKIAASEFEVPAGYTKHEAKAHPDMGGMSRHMTGGGNTPTPRAMPTPKP